MSRVSLLYHFARHTRSRQIAARLRLMGKRTILSALSAPAAAAAAAASKPPPPRAESPPLSIFRPRRHLVSDAGGGLHLDFLNVRRPLTIPMRWHGDDLEVGTRLWKLNLHYMEFLEALDDVTFQEVVEDWIRGNPPYRRGYWLDNWNSYALSIRAVVWMQETARRSPRLPRDFLERTDRSLASQIRFLARNLELDITGNHLIKNVKALVWAGAHFTGPEAESWRRLGTRLLEREVREQVLPDGMHFELSPAYHGQVLADVVECHHALPEGEARAGLVPVVARMAQALADTTHPDGFVSLFNDGGLHMGYPVDEVLEACSRVTGTLPKATPRAALMDAGYFTARDERSLFIADCGPIAPDHLPAHGHGDALSFEWTLEGRRVVVDAGVFEYNAGDRRAYSRSTRSHNTVTVDDRDQCEFWGAFRMGMRATVVRHEYRALLGGFVLHGSHDGFARLRNAPRHHRRFAATPHRIEVEDWVDGGVDQAVRARILLHPDAHVETVPDGLRIVVGDVRAMLVTKSPVRLERAWWSPDFGVWRETGVAVLEYGTAPCRGRFVLEKEEVV